MDGKDESRDRETRYEAPAIIRVRDGHGLDHVRSSETEHWVLMYFEGKPT